MSQQPIKPKSGGVYSYLTRKLFILLLFALVLIGALQDLGAFWKSISAIPMALAPGIVWVLVTFAVVWLLVDLIMRNLCGKSLRELIDANDDQFEQMLAVALVIAIPIILLVATK